MSETKNIDTMSARLRPFFSYFGGKWRDAPSYPAPFHVEVIEPFAGSAGYALRYPQHRVSLYDIDPIVCGVWSFLLRAGESEILALPDVPTGGSVLDLDLPQEARWLIGFWLNAGSASPKISPSKWMRDGASPGSFWGPKIRERIASQQKHVRHWTITEASYDSIDVRAATWFVDPPYQGAGVNYRYSSVDYTRLGQWCQSREGQVIVCENAGASWLPFRPHASRKTTRHGARSEEAVWVKAR